MCALAAACRSNSAEPSGSSQKSDEIAARVDKLQEEEGEVISRRDALTRERQRVAADRQALEEKKKAVQAQGGDSKEVEAEEKALVAREAKLTADESEVQKKLDTLLSRYRVEATSTAQTADTTRREAQVAAREKDLGRRESTLAERERGLADREKELAKRERDTCGGGATTIVQSAPERGSKYTRRDVEPLLASARRKMAEKGLLASDLPAPAKSLEREATAAMGTGEWGKAKFAADQLVVTVESIKVDNGFIKAKITRLNSSMKGSKLGGDSQKQADDLFREATADYGDGKFASANVKLNRIYALMQ